MFWANPSPEGRGCRGAAGEGYNNEKTLKKYLRYPSPGPLARATLSLQEREQFTNSILTKVEAQPRKHRCCEREHGEKYRTEN